MKEVEHPFYTKESPKKEVYCGNMLTQMVDMLPVNVGLG
jgi:hypothetical protein